MRRITTRRAYGVGLRYSSPKRGVRRTLLAAERRRTDLIRLFREENGQALVEYAIIIAVIAVALIVALVFLQVQLDDVFSDIGRCLRRVARGRMCEAADDFMD
jgi:Flp pilus assembly pilin Flp